MSEFKGSDSNRLFLQSRDTLSPAASPALRAKDEVRGVMGSVCLALTPAVVGSVVLFGFGVLPLYLISIITAVACDYLVCLLRKRVFTMDGSAVVTGALLAMSLPASVPLWLPAVAAAVGILVGKELFGGIGFNFLNPALTGRAFVRLAFPAFTMANPVPTPPFSSLPDAVAGATPLAVLKSGGALSPAALWDSFIGTVPGKLGETSALLLLIGAAFLLLRGIIDWRIPTAFFAALALMAWVFGGPAGLFSGGVSVIAGHLLGGASILGGFFMITDYGSSPSAPAARFLFGALCGVVTMGFRLLSPWAEGFTFAILICNLTVPLMNRFIRPRVLGEARKGGAKAKE